MHASSKNSLTDIIKFEVTRKSFENKNFGFVDVVRLQTGKAKLIPLKKTYQWCLTCFLSNTADQIPMTQYG